MLKTKTKRTAKRFINHLYGMLPKGVRHIPVRIIWNYPALRGRDDEYGFGVFLFDSEKPPTIFVAGAKQGKRELLNTIAHEFAHYMQWLEGLDMYSPKRETEAEETAKVLVKGWCKNG